MKLLTDNAYVISEYQGTYHAVLFWGGEPDYRGSTTDPQFALAMVTARESFILSDPANGELTRIACPDGIWPETRVCAK